MNETVDADGTVYYDDSITTPAFVASELKRLEYDDTVLGVIAYIDAPGGTPAAAERIMNVLASSRKPVVAQGGDMMTSGGYLAALGALRIIASPYTEVGAIGVTYSYVDNVKKNETEGLSYVELASAPYKDYGDPNRPLTDAERALIKRDADIYHNIFVDQVALRRALPREEVARLADGASMPSSMALEHKLIDGIGDEQEALIELAALLGVSSDTLEVCR
jgi:protease-4